MKQLRIFFLSLLILCLNSSVLFAQTGVKQAKVTFDHILPSGATTMTQVIHDDLFLVYNDDPKLKRSYVAYDSNLKQVFRIPLEYTTYYPYITYNKALEQVVIIEFEHKKGAYHVKAKSYTTAGKLVKQESMLLEGKADKLQKVALAEDGSYFAFLVATGKGDRDRVITVYDAALNKQYSKEFKVKEKEAITAYTINTSGNVLMTSITENGPVTFYKVDLQGQVSQTVAAKEALSGKEEYTGFILKTQGDRFVVAAQRNFKDRLKAIDLFDVDFATQQVKTGQSIEFDSENVEKIYSKVNEEHILNKNYSLLSSKYKKPEYITSLVMRELVVENEHIYLVSESRHITLSSKQRSHYFANDILVTAFQGKDNIWNSVIGRRMYAGDFTLGGWASIQAVVRSQDKALLVLTSEYNMGTMTDVSSYLRTVSKQDGQVSAPKRLLTDSFWSNSSFTAWLKPDHLLLFRTEKVMQNKKTEFYLNLLKLNNQQVQ